MKAVAGEVPYVHYRRNLGEASDKWMYPIFIVIRRKLY